MLFIHKECVRVFLYTNFVHQLFIFVHSCIIFTRQNCKMNRSQKLLVWWILWGNCNCTCKYRGNEIMWIRNELRAELACMYAWHSKQAVVLRRCTLKLFFRPCKSGSAFQIKKRSRAYRITLSFPYIFPSYRRGYFI